MGAVDFRVGGRIFATLASVKQGFGNLMLTPEVTGRVRCRRAGHLHPYRRRLGTNGRHAHSPREANRDLLTGALQRAWQLRVDKNAAGLARSSVNAYLTLRLSGKVATIDSPSRRLPSRSAHT
jgi:hypothetical protein